MQVHTSQRNKTEQAPIMYGMKKTTTIALLALLIAGTVSLFDGSEYSSLLVVLRGNESVNGVHDEKRFYFYTWCDIDFPPDSSLQSRIFGSEGLWNMDFEPNPNTLCDLPVCYKLQGDGNFIIKCGANNTTEYITHSNQGHTGNFFMAIDSFCQLHIFEGTFE
jgi:hypothetical protein